MLQISDKAPDFTLPDENAGDWSLSEHSGEKLLLVFYPGDNTPVCTRQLCDYRDGVEAFAGLGVTVVGISNDKAETHQKFKQKHKLPFPLLTDADLKVAEQYDSKGLLGMKRSLFLIDQQGLIRYLHIETLSLFRRSRDEVLEAITNLE